MRPQEKRIGPSSLAELGAFVGRLKPRRAMLVTGGDSYACSGARDLVEPAIAQVEVVRFEGVSPNPKIEDVERGIALWRRKRPDLILAVGGGSVLDTAKLIGLLGPSAEPWSAFPSGRVAERDDVPVIAIPTTAGSGAEATRFATFYVDGEKQSLSHPRLRPSFVIIDPLLAASVPWALAASAGLDALSQAIESLWAVAATPESQALAEAALREILPCLREAVLAPTPRLRERMARGAHLAGQAIDISRTTAAHALSYALTIELNVPHGHAVALLLPSIFRINARPEGREVSDPRGAARVAEAVERVRSLLGRDNGEDAARALEHLVSDLGLATRLRGQAAGASTTAARLAGKVNAERLNNNPVAISERDAIDIYARLFVSEGVAGAVA